MMLFLIASVCFVFVFFFLSLSLSVYISLIVNVVVLLKVVYALIKKDALIVAFSFISYEYI